MAGRFTSLDTSDITVSVYGKFHARIYAVSSNLSLFSSVIIFPRNGRAVLSSPPVSPDSGATCFELPRGNFHGGANFRRVFASRRYIVVYISSRAPQRKTFYRRVITFRGDPPLFPRWGFTLSALADFTAFDSCVGREENIEQRRPRLFSGRFYYGVLCAQDRKYRYIL